MLIDSFDRFGRVIQIPTLAPLFPDFDPLIATCSFDWNVDPERQTGLRDVVHRIGYPHWADRFQLPAPTTAVELPEILVVAREQDPETSKGLAAFRSFWVLAPTYDEARQLGTRPEPSIPFEKTPVLRSWILVAGIISLNAIAPYGITANRPQLLWQARLSDANHIYEFECERMVVTSENHLLGVQIMNAFALTNVQAAFELIMALDLPEAAPVEELPLESGSLSQRRPIVRLLEASQVDRFLAIRSSPNARPARVLARS